MNYEEIIKTDYKILESLPENEIFDVVTEIISHYRKSGFPYFPIDKEKIKKEHDSLVKTDIEKMLVDGNNIQQGMVGLNTCNTFHPSMFSTKCRNAKSPMEIFSDDKLFRVALTKRIKYNDRYLNDGCVRRTLTAFGGQAVSNFRPSVAKFIYQKYCPQNGKVLDPCAGYGGRLMGAFCSHVSSYTGVDPSSNSFSGNTNLYNALLEASPSRKFNIVLEKIPFEDYVASDEEFDLVFTSPPYFNVEKYSEEKTQSYIRHENYNDWLSNFLTPLIENSWKFLKTGGYLVLNVGNPIVEDTLRIGTIVFKNEPKTYHMRLSKFLGKGNKSNVKHKLEPIFIWKKVQ